MKVRGDEQSVTKSGKLFHARGSGTALLLSPSVERRVAGITLLASLTTHVRDAVNLVIKLHPSITLM